MAAQMDNRKKVFISGAITARRATYRNFFCDAQMTLEFLGYIVLNPAWLPWGLSDRGYKQIDDAMMEEADVICMLPSWQKSSGAKREYALAEEWKKEIIYYGNLDVMSKITEMEKKYA